MASVLDATPRQPPQEPPQDAAIPLHRTIPLVNGLAGTVNHHSARGLGNFQLAIWGIFNWR
jgi:hypothetical protein